MHPREIGTGVYDQVIELCQRAGFMPHVAQEARETPTVLGLVASAECGSGEKKSIGANPHLERSQHFG
jgi:hypothetical protein